MYFFPVSWQMRDIISGALFKGLQRKEIFFTVASV